MRFSSIIIILISVLNTSFSQEDGMHFNLGLSAGVLSYSEIETDSDEEHNWGLTSVIYEGYTKKYNYRLTYGLIAGLGFPIYKQKNGMGSFGLATTGTFSIYFNSYFYPNTPLHEISLTSEVGGELELFDPIYNQEFLVYYRKYSVNPFRAAIFSTGFKYNSSQLGAYMSPIIKLDCELEVGVQIGIYSSIISDKEFWGLSNGERIVSKKRSQHGITITYRFAKR